MKNEKRGRLSSLQEERDRRELEEYRQKYGLPGTFAQSIELAMELLRNAPIDGDEMSPEEIKGTLQEEIDKLNGKGLVDP